MTQTDLLRVALAQSAIDLNCAPEDLVSGKKLVVELTTKSTETVNGMNA